MHPDHGRLPTDSAVTRLDQAACILPGLLQIVPQVLSCFPTPASYGNLSECTTPLLQTLLSFQSEGQTP